MNLRAGFTVSTAAGFPVEAIARRAAIAPVVIHLNIVADDDTQVSGK